LYDLFIIEVEVREFSRPLTSDNPEFWESRYQEQRTPWDLGEVAPPFVALLEGHKAIHHLTLN
jgi:hypothetical protein